MARGQTVHRLDLGLYIGGSPLQIPEGALTDGLNFRIKHGRVEANLLGWEELGPWALNGPVTLIDNFFPFGAGEMLIFGTPKDLYLFDEAANNVLFLTPRYETGTASASGTTVTGTGTAWVTAGIKAGDQITFGAAGVRDPAAAWYEIASVDSDTQLTLVSSAGTVSAGPYTIRRVFTASPSDTWSVDVFVGDAVTGNDIWIATNGVDPIVTWDGMADQVTRQDGLGFLARVVTVHSNFAFYGDITDNGIAKPTTIFMSDVGKPLVVGNAAAGLAGEFKVHAGLDPINNMVPLGDMLVIYSDRHLVVAQLTGDATEVLAFREVIAGVGAVGGQAIADFGDFHTFLSADGQYLFDGAAVREIAGHVWRDVLRQADTTRLFRVFVHFDEEQGDLIWSVPLMSDADSGNKEGQAEVALVEHYLEDVGANTEAPYSKRDFPFTATGYWEQAESKRWSDMGLQTWADAALRWNDRILGAAFPINLAGDKNGKVWKLYTTNTRNGAPVESWVRTRRYQLGKGWTRDLVRRVYPLFVEGAGQVSVVTRIRDHAESATPVEKTETFDLTLPEEKHFVTPFVLGRFVEFEVRSTGAEWTLDGFAVETVPGGKH